jgi:integrase/recombinase XerD
LDGNKKFKRAYMTPAQVNRFINVIPRDTVNGKMHYAMMKFYLLTGRRNSEVRLIQWKHFDVQPDGRVNYTWYGKHHGDREGQEDGEVYELPRECWEAIEDYLRSDGRWGQMRPTEYLFTAHSDVAKYFGRETQTQIGDEPLSTYEPVRIVKMYARNAGLEARNLGVHSLRHTLGHGLKDSGVPVEDIKNILGHANINTTMIYLREDEHPVSEAQHRMSDMFGFASADKRRGLKHLQ